MRHVLAEIDRKLNERNIRSDWAGEVGSIYLVLPTDSSFRLTVSQPRTPVSDDVVFEMYDVRNDFALITFEWDSRDVDEIVAELFDIVTGK